MSDLEALERTYLAPGLPGAPIHREDSEWTPLVDGVEYLRAVDDEVSRTRCRRFAVRGGAPARPGRRPARARARRAGHEPVGALLVAAAARGVDVRVIIAGQRVHRRHAVPGRSLPREPSHGDPIAGLAAVPGAGPDDPAPLSARVLLDWSGHRLGTNHQKAVVGHQRRRADRVRGRDGHRTPPLRRAAARHDATRRSPLGLARRRPADPRSRRARGLGDAPRPLAGGDVAPGAAGVGRGPRRRGVEPGAFGGPAGSGSGP